MPTARRRSSSLTFVTVVLTTLLSIEVSRADMTLTTAAECRGFTLVTFASNFQPIGHTIGPLGVAYIPGNEVLVSYLGTPANGSKIYRLPSHADNQVGPFPVSASYPFGDAICMAQIPSGSGQRYFLGQQVSGTVIEVDVTGNPILTIASGINRPTGIAPYPPDGLPVGLDGHLFVTDDDQNIWDIDTAPPYTRVLFANGGGSGADGLSFSPDGSRLYVAYVSENLVRGFDVPGGSEVWKSCPHPGGPDGTAIGLGSLEGYLYLNCNDGTVWEVGLPGTIHESEATMIATGGSRGDFIAADPNVPSGGSYPSLLLTQTDRILRLDPPGGGFFGPPTSSADPVQTVSAPPSDGKIGPDRATVYPNPFRSMARVNFALVRAGVVEVQIYDVAGRLTRTLFSGNLEAGPHDVAWDGLDAGRTPAKAGLYFVRVRSGGTLLDTHVVRLD